MYSIKNELAFLRLFTNSEYTADRKCYSEEEIQAAEKLLCYKLPDPVRCLYQYMGDLLVDSDYLKPLELLHWEGNCLGFFLSPNTNMIIGICKDDAPNALFKWENGDYKGEACDYLDEIEEAYEEGNFPDMQAALKDYLAYWEKQAAPADFSPKPLQHSLRYNCSLDAHCIFLSIHAICECAELSGKNFFISENVCFEQSQFEQLALLNKKITQIFAPLSVHTELIYNGSPILMAYRHENPYALLVLRDDDSVFTLLTAEKAEDAFLADFENRTGLKVIQNNIQAG